MNANIHIPTRDELNKVVSEAVKALLERNIPKIIRRTNRKEYLTTAAGCSHRIQTTPIRKEAPLTGRPKDFQPV